MQLIATTAFDTQASPRCYEPAPHQQATAAT
jgi:hypothetical protein